MGTNMLSWPSAVEATGMVIHRGTPASAMSA